jgi:adenylate kinase
MDDWRSGVSWPWSKDTRRARIMLTGVPAVGKTTIATHSLLDDVIERVRFGKIMEEIGLRKKIIKDPSDLPSLGRGARSRLQKLAVEVVLKKSEVGSVLIDGHLTVESTEGLVPGLPFECVSSLKLTAIVVLTATPAEILKRREDDPSKYVTYRNDEPRVTFHQETLLAGAWTYAMLSGAAFDAVANPHARQAETAAALRELLSRLMPAS